MSNQFPPEFPYTIGLLRGMLERPEIKTVLVKYDFDESHHQKELKRLLGLIAEIFYRKDYGER